MLPAWLLTDLLSSWLLGPLWCNGEPLPRRTPPPHGSFKINCDGAFGKHTGRGAIGIVIRDSAGNVVCLRAVSPWGDDALTVEGRAVYHALLTGRRMGFTNVLGETDCAARPACMSFTTN